MILFSYSAGKGLSGVAEQPSFPGSSEYSLEW